MVFGAHENTGAFTGWSRLHESMPFLTPALILYIHSSLECISTGVSPRTPPSFWNVMDCTACQKQATPVCAALWPNPRLLPFLPFPNVAVRLDSVWGHLRGNVKNHSRHCKATLWREYDCNFQKIRFGNASRSQALCASPGRMFYPSVTTCLASLRWKADVHFVGKNKSRWVTDNDFEASSRHNHGFYARERLRLQAYMYLSSLAERHLPETTNDLPHTTPDLLLQENI